MENNTTNTIESTWYAPELSQNEDLQPEQAQTDNDYKIQIQLLEIERLQKELQQKDEEIKQLTQNREQRKTFAKWVLIVVSIWLGITIAIVLFHIFAQTYRLDDKVLCTLLGATAVVSLATTVLKGLFS